MYKYSRYISSHILPWLNKGKVILIYGARQVGKTTLSKKIIEQNKSGIYLNCEQLVVKEVLESGNLESIWNVFQGNKLVVLDEAQKIRSIGETLKLIHDTYPDIQLIATGSSSFDLSAHVKEPLTGRNIKFIVFPLSISEIAQNYNVIQLKEKAEQLLRFGSYPDIIDRPEQEKKILLEELASDYLFRDVLSFENLKYPDLLIKLLKAIALQLGSEVSERELSNLLNVNIATIQRYLSLLEKSFVIFKLTAFSRNLRNEIATSQKYYFFDLGIRNSLLHNFAPLDVRTDTGALWENFCILERMKLNQERSQKVNYYFWRTYDQKEIDLIEEYDGKLSAFEFKWNDKKKVKAPKVFMDAYPMARFSVITPDKLMGWGKIL
jgi:predicted AAA+ superfamily ATPase